MKHLQIICALLLYTSVSAQQKLQGTIDVKDGQATGPVILIGELSPVFCAGDKIRLKISGTANVGPTMKKGVEEVFSGFLKKGIK